MMFVITHVIIIYCHVTVTTESSRDIYLWPYDGHVMLVKVSCDMCYLLRDHCLETYV